MPRARSTSQKSTPAPTPSVDPKEQRRLDSRAEDSQLIKEALGGDDAAYTRLMNK